MTSKQVDHIGAWLGACIGMPWNPEHCHDLGLLVEVFMAVIEASQCKQQKHEALQHLEAYYYQIIRVRQLVVTVGFWHLTITSPHSALASKKPSYFSLRNR